MSEPNPSWGSPRIRSELRKLGIDVAKYTVEKYRVGLRKPSSPTWRAFLAAHLQLATEFLPPYAPELNPIEYVWSYLKLNPLANLAFFDPEQLTTTARRHTRSLQRKPDLLRSFLRHSPLPLRLNQDILYAWINRTKGRMKGTRSSRARIVIACRRNVGPERRRHPESYPSKI
jgi:transposase